MEAFENALSSEIIEANSSEICKLIENKCLKPLEIKPSEYIKEELSADSYFYQGYLSRLRGDFDAAIAQYRAGLKLGSSHNGLKLNLAVCFMKIGLISKALELNKELHIPQAYINSGICLIAQRQYLSAIDEIRKAIAVRPEPGFYQLLSLALFRAGKVTEALEAFKEVPETESLIEDERNLRIHKNPNAMFPFKVGEVDVLMRKNREKSQRSSRSSMKTSMASTRRASRSPRSAKLRPESPVQAKGVEYATVDFVLKERRMLPSFDQIVLKKRELDQVIRRRHNTIVEAMEKGIPNWNYDGFVQQKVETTALNIYEEISMNQGRYKKMDKIKKKISMQDPPVDIKDEFDLDKYSGKRLSENMLNLVNQEYFKAKPERNYDLLEKVLRKLPFFSKFPNEIRFQLLKFAEFKQFNADQVIIKQGEIGDEMFVILSGSIKILKCSPDFGNMELIINSMYDGETFGELALLSEGIGDVRRSATCVAGENTTLLAISKKNYKAILLDEMQNDIMGKVKFFNKLVFFTECPSISLIPLASNIEAVRYKIDDRIIELGEKPKGLYIIYKGRCNLYWEGYVAKPARASGVANVKIRPKTPRPYFTGNLEPRIIPSKHRARQSLHLSAEEQAKAREYVPADLQEKVVTKERILCKPLKEGDFFGGRALIEGILDLENEFDSPQKVTFELIQAKPAKFTVVAESSEVKVFILTRRHFPLLSEEIIVTET